MKLQIGRKAVWAALAVAAVAGVLVAADRLDARVDPRTYDLRKKVLGKSVGQWTAEWWQWFFSLPGDKHPFLDTTGKFVSIGQYGPVWFITGGAGAATIPAGKSLLIAIYNVDEDQLDPTTQTVVQMRTAAAKYIDAFDVSKVSVTIDGVPLTGLAKMRVTSPPFEYTTPDDGIYFTSGAGFPGGIYKPAVSDGYWVFLKPLAVGDHVVAVVSPAGDSTHSFHVVDHDRL